MEYLEFLNAVKDHINSSSADVSVCVHSALKNNGVKLSGLSFVKKGFNASPTIYMENYYEDYKNGEDICDIADRLLVLYRENDMSVKLDMSFFEDFESVKDRLYIKLINMDKNADFLKDVPYEPFLDLAIVAYVRVYDRRIGNGVIMVKNDHLKLWGISCEEVMRQAKKNTHDHDGFFLRHIVDVLNTVEKAPLCLSEEERGEFPMYVVTNKKMTNGAAVLAMNDKMKEYAEVLGGDYYVIPSSVHELILLKQNTENGTCDINGMIREVNATQLGADDVLADHVYLYRAKDEVLIF